MQNATFPARIWRRSLRIVGHVSAIVILLGHHPSPAAASLFTDLYGGMFVADNQNGHVDGFDAETGALKSTFTFGGPGAPVDIVFGSNPEQFFVSDGFNKRILRFAPAPFPVSVFSELDGSGAIPLVLTPGGNLLAGIILPNDDSRIDEFDGVTGALVRSYEIVPQLDAPRGMAFGPDGLLYVTSTVTDAVVRFDPTTGDYVDTFVAAGSGGLNGPGGLVFAADGSLLVTSFGPGQAEVLKFDGTTGAFLNVFASAPGIFWDLAFGPDGGLYVTQTTSGSVLRYDGTTGDFIDVFVELPGNVNSPAFPMGIAFQPFPEPSGVALAMLGVVVLAGMRKRSRTK